MASEPVLTGALAIIKVQTPSGLETVGLMRNVRVNENTRRVPIRGLGSILPKEAPVVEWAGSISCSFWEINYEKSGIKNAIRRDVGLGNAGSQIAGGINTPNFEDQLVLDPDGVQINIFKKLSDVIDPNTQLINPKAVPYAIVGRCLIESDNITIDEGNVSGRDQTFLFLDPVLRNP